MVLLAFCGYFKDSISGLITGSIVGIALRWAVYLLTSGVPHSLLLAMHHKGKILGFNSMVYNASYMVPDGILNIVVLLFIYQGVKRGLRRRG